MRPFLLVWNSAQIEVFQGTLLAFLDTRREIRNYYVPFLGAVLLIADHAQSPLSLSNLIHDRFPTLLLTVLPADQWATQGWMPRPFWDLVHNPKSSGRWDLANTPPPSLKGLGNLK
jgi:hypothetical protein